MVLRVGLFGQVRGADEKGSGSVFGLGEYGLRVQQTRAFTDDPDLKFIRELLHEGCQLFKHGCGIEMLPIERQDERPLAPCVKACSHRRLQQCNTVRGGECGDEHEVLRLRDIATNLFKPGATHGGREKLQFHNHVLASRTELQVVAMGIPEIADLARRILSNGPSVTRKGEIEQALQKLASQDTDFRDQLDAELEREQDGQFVGLLVKNLENIQGDERDVVTIFAAGIASTATFAENDGVFLVDPQEVAMIAQRPVVGNEDLQDRANAQDLKRHLGTRADPMWALCRPLTQKMEAFIGTRLAQHVQRCQIPALSWPSNGLL